MDMDSSTVLAPEFLPALRPGETSHFDFGFYTADEVAQVGFWITDIALVAPTPPTATVTVMSMDPPRVVTVTATSVLTAEASATDSETSATVGSGSESEEDRGGGGGLSDGVKLRLASV